MRIALVNWSRRRAGGVETYLSSIIIPELQRLKHNLLFWSEVDAPQNRERIPIPEGVPALCASDIGEDESLAALRDWHPDLLYVHKVTEPRVEARLLDIAPAILFAHDYYGTCISGLKTFKRPTTMPCTRAFGWECLLHYYPNRCGGLNPLTMLKDYSRQSKRLEMLSKYRAILTGSEHMRAEFIRNGINPDKVFNVSLPVVWSGEIAGENGHGELENGNGVGSYTDSRDDFAGTQNNDTGNGESKRWRLLFLGRMSNLKGGETFLEALPTVRASIAKPLRVTFAGDGPQRTEWERKAAKLRAQDSDLEIRFIGWVNDDKLDTVLLDSDLLVMPSLWPEPFGLVGPEAGLRGVPAVAFAVGGIADWLHDGVNGLLASGDPPTSSSLAEAIVRCLRDPAKLAQMRQEARKVAETFSMQRHLSALAKVFEKVAGSAST